MNNLKIIKHNGSIPELVEQAILRKEGTLGIGGSFMVSTGRHTGRSPNDKFFVRTSLTEGNIDWTNNGAMEPSSFAILKADMLNHIGENEVFVQDLYAGAHPDYRLNIRVITELAWHSLFIRHLLRIPESTDGFEPDYTIINCPSFKAAPAKHGCRSETVIAINMDEKIILVCGTEYAGEIKKAVFTLMNYILPEKEVMPMHCSANHDFNNADKTAIFFGLSGTGKTTLSSDPERILIGDDEHGWSDDGVFNFEGGCYAKTINLDPQAEPEIYATTRRFGTIIENMVFDPHTREPDFKDDSLTANMRCAYPLNYIPNVSETSMGGHPKNIIMLTCDAFGILPPVAKLTPEQAVYHFLSGFTSKVAGTECGITEPVPTFSTCFGAPFMPRPATDYGDLLHKKIIQHGAQCWLVNTGWTGGGYGVGSRISLKDTRTLLHSVLDGNIYKSEYRQDPNFGFSVPIYVDGVNKGILNPRDTWADPLAYDAQARKLIDMFTANFQKFADKGHVDNISSITTG